MNGHLWDLTRGMPRKDESKWLSFASFRHVRSRGSCKTERLASITRLVYTPLIRLTFLVCTALLAGCADRAHVLHVSVADQKMAVYRYGTEIARYDVSTSKFGLGDRPGSNGTPLGDLAVAKKIGGGAPVGMKFKSRKPTGEIVPVNAPGRDPIVTRILWLKGLESQNKNAYDRMIYIHGTPEEVRIGTPASYGCVRMRSTDIVQLFDTVGEGARVKIFTEPLPSTPAPAQPAVQNVTAAVPAAPESPQVQQAL
ncbi:MAG: L,D-transpeptidase [Verrucomicrobiaceae bacterium]|nr:MAG: L,D-transpeptidase [Verrucomicrobiaceae bacterium]